MLVVVPVDPPREGFVLEDIVESTPLSAAEAVALYEAAVGDALRAVTASGGDLLVNYRDEETLPDEFGGGDPESGVRDLVDDALEDVDGVRFERQVGSSRSARVGNTVTHLLEREDAGSVGVLEPTVPLVGRSEIDQTAMALRRDDVVLGPASNGDVYITATTEVFDFTDVYMTPALATLARGADDAGLDAGFASMLPTIATESGLCTTLAMLEARETAGRRGASATAAVVDELSLTVGSDGSLERE